VQASLLIERLERWLTIPASSIEGQVTEWKHYLFDCLHFIEAPLNVVRRVYLWGDDGAAVGGEWGWGFPFGGSLIENDRSGGGGRSSRSAAARLRAAALLRRAARRLQPLERLQRAQELRVRILEVGAREATGLRWLQDPEAQHL
jgi:hypothetical protein